MRSFITVISPVVLSGILAWGQGPVTDKVKVHFPNPVVVAGTTLPAGEYMIRQLPSQNNPRVLEFSSNNGTTVEVTTTAYPILDNMNRKPTSVILEQRGGTYHVSKIWLAGKNYGYGLPAGGSGTMTGATRDDITLRASYTPDGTQTTTTTTTTTTEETTVAQAAPPVEQPAQQQQAQPEPQPEPAPEPAPQTQTQEDAQTQTQAQATPPEQPAPTPAPSQTGPEPAPTTTQDTRPMREIPAMPDTASHWALLLLAGGALTATGLRVRR